MTLRRRAARAVRPGGSAMASSMVLRGAIVAAVLACATLCANSPVLAHGFAGKRFFPATLVIEDPFVADELSLPTISYFKQPASGDEPATKETGFSADISKRITENFG